MLKNFKPVSLILCAGALCFSGSMYANIAPVEQGTSISQQNGKVTGTVEDDFGPVTGASVVVKGTTMVRLPIWTVISPWKVSRMVM